MNRFYKTQTVEERFWPKVNKNTCLEHLCGCKQNIGHCWPWTASIFKTTKYGQFNMIRNNGKWGPVPAHRFAYELIYGPINAKMLCCHHCDNRQCCNPQHLFVGTHQDNMNDAKMKHRFPGNPRGKGPILHGIENPNAKLTNEMIILIRQADPLKSQKQLAHEYGVTQTTISRIQRGNGWTHIDSAPQKRNKGFHRGEYHWSHINHEKVKRAAQHPNYGKHDHCGEHNHAAKLTDNDVLMIRSYKGNYTCKMLAAQFNVSPALICLIQNYKIWKHLP